MKTVKTTYTFNGVEYEEYQHVTLNFKIALRNLDTVLNRWSKLMRFYEVGSACEVANDIPAKWVTITAYAVSMYKIFIDLGCNDDSLVRDKVSVCQHRFAKNKSFWSERVEPKGYFVVYTPGNGWKFVDNTPSVVKGNQLKWNGRIYRRNLPFKDIYFSNH
jgi:hypothetical protein